MPQYFFDTNDGDRHVPDADGLDLPDRDAARAEALTALRDMARDHLPDGDRRDFTVKVRDGADKAIYAAALSLVGGWTD